MSHERIRSVNTVTRWFIFSAAVLTAIIALYYRTGKSEAGGGLPRCESTNKLSRYRLYVRNTVAPRYT